MKALLLFILGLNAHAASRPTACGTYDIYGVIEKEKSAVGYVFLTNKGTLSEFRFPITEDQELKIAPYIRHPIKLRGRIIKKIDGTIGSFEKIEKLEHVVFDPANMKGLNGFFLVKEEKCK